MPGPLDIDHARQFTNADRPLIPSRPVRLERGDTRSYVDTAAIKQHSVDPFAASAPLISDLVGAFGPAISPGRNRTIETVRAQAVNFRLASKKHRTVTQWTTGARAAIVGVDLGFSALVVAKMHVAQGLLQGAGHASLAHLKHAEAIGAEIAATGVALAAETVPHAAEHTTTGSRDEHAESLRYFARAYPERTAAWKRERSAASAVRTLLGEHGRTAYEATCSAVDELVPIYANKVADTLHFADSFDVSDTPLKHLFPSGRMPHFKLAPANRFARSFEDVGGRDVSQKLFTEIVKEYTYVAHAHNQRFERAAPHTASVPRNPDRSQVTNRLSHGAAERRATEMASRSLAAFDAGR